MLGSRLIARMLHIANAMPPSLCREEFYALKTRLLKQHGEQVCWDVQHIVNKCWGYGGRGCFGRGCDRCGGTGIHSEKWVLLGRWQWHGYTFHQPERTAYSLERLYAPESCTSKETIEGRITHPFYSHHLSSECALWLFLLFDRRAFRHEFGSFGCHKPVYPLTVVGTVAFDVRTLVYSVRRLPTRVRWAIEKWRYEHGEIPDDEYIPF